MLWASRDRKERTVQGGPEEIRDPRVMSGPLVFQVTRVGLERPVNRGRGVCRGPLALRENPE